MRWQLEFYENARGRRPVVEYMNDLVAAERAKVIFDLELLAENGINLGAPQVRSLRDKLWELRTSGRVQHRIIYFAMSGRRIVLLHAFTKKTRQTPQAEIDTAARRLADYLERRGGV